AGDAVDDDVVDESLLAFSRDRVNKPDLFVIAFLRQLHDGKIDSHVDVAFARIQRGHAIAIRTRLRPRIGRADDGAQLPTDSLVSVNLVPLYFHARHARQRSFSNVERDDQVVAVD